MTQKRLGHAKKRAFLAAFRETGNVRLACETAGTGRSSHYRWLGDDPEYCAAFEMAEEDAADNSGEAPVDSGLLPEVVDATREPESKPDMVIEDEPEETPNVESELLVDATAEAASHH